MKRSPFQNAASVIAQRTYRDDEGEFTVGIRPPYQDGGDWYCEVFAIGLKDSPIRVGGIDQLQAIRLALQILDSLVMARPNAQSSGITGIF